MIERYLRWYTLFIICIGGLAVGSVVAADAEDQAALIKKLGNDDFDTRQEAADKLKALGEAARPALESALKNSDLQVVDVAKSLLSKLETASLLLLAYDREGKPAFDAQVDVSFYDQDQGGQPNTQSVTMSADGSAKLAGLAPGLIRNGVTWKKWTPLPEFANGYGSLQAGLNPVMAILSRGGSVSVVIKDNNGKPLKDAQVTLNNNSQFGGFESEIIDLQLQLASMWGGTQTALSEHSNADGKLNIENVPDGVMSAIIQMDGYFSKVVPHVRVLEGEVTALPDIVLEPRISTKVSMILRSGDKTPLKSANVCVVLEPVFTGLNAKKLEKKYHYIQQQLDMRRQVGVLKTDENGKVTLENIALGKYRLCVDVQNGSDATQQLGEVEIKAGDKGAKEEKGIFDLGTLDFNKGGSIRGKVVTQNGQPISSWNIAATHFDDLEDLNGNGRFNNFRGRSRAGNNHTQQDGSYEIKNLRPGKYAISVYAQSQTGMNSKVTYFDVSVESEKNTDAPDIVITEEKTDASKNFAFKGRVLMPDGSPAAGAMIMLYYGRGGSSQNQTNEKGEFDLSYMSRSLGNMNNSLQKMSVSILKCKTVTVDLSDKNLNLAALLIQLEKQEYASLNVKIVDEAGLPVSGVSVRPRQKQNNQWGVLAYPKIKTNSQGVARLTGLSTGKRFLEIEKSGYYLKEEPAATVTLAENEVAVVLLKCLSVKGKLIFPPDGSAKTGVVSAVPSSNPWIGTGASTVIRENGEFELNGLVPGEYNLSTTLVEFALAEPIKFTFENDKQIPVLSVPLRRRGGAALEVGKAYAGRAVGLMRAEQWQFRHLLGRADNPWTNATSSGDITDVDGHVLIWGASIGKYRLSATAISDQMPNQYGNNGEHTLSVSCISDVVDVTELKNYKDLYKQTFKPAVVPAGTGCVSGRLIFEKSSNALSWSNENQTCFIVWLVGEHALGTTTFYSYEFLNNPANQTTILGTAPPEYKASLTGQFKGEGFPAGEYQVYLDVNSYGNRRIGRNSVASKAAQKAESISIGKFTLNDGQKFDLGDLQADAALAQSNLLEKQENLELGSDDIVPVFQP